MIQLPFANRVAAGRLLAARLAGHLGEPAAGAPLLVVALPRGGVPVAAMIAQRLHAPLDLLLVRKIGAPGQPELAVAALVDGTPPQVVADEALCARLGVDEAWLAAGARAGIAENERRRQRYLGARAPLPVAGRTVIVVDDGAATGTTLIAALQALRAQDDGRGERLRAPGAHEGARGRGPSRLVAAVPVASREAAARIAPLVDDWVCLAEPAPFEAVGRHYGDFEQVGDDEVVRWLAEAAAAAVEVAPATNAINTTKAMDPTNGTSN